MYRFAYLCGMYEGAVDLSEVLIRLSIEGLEGSYLVTSDDVPGFVAQGRTVAQATEISQDVTRKLIESYREHGDATEDSDIDLLVVSPDFGRDVLADMVLLRDCLPPHDVDIDTIARTPEQVASAEPDSFLSTVLEDGILIYESAAQHP